MLQNDSFPQMGVDKFSPSINYRTYDKLLILNPIKSFASVDQVRCPIQASVAR